MPVEASRLTGRVDNGSPVGISNSAAPIFPKEYPLANQLGTGLRRMNLAADPWGIARPMVLVGLKSCPRNALFIAQLPCDMVFPSVAHLYYNDRLNHACA